jgi:hypothetical protein
LPPGDVMRNGYSEDKIAEGDGEDQPGRLFLQDLNNTYMPNSIKYHGGRSIRHCTMLECHEV